MLTERERKALDRLIQASEKAYEDYSTPYMDGKYYRGVMSGLQKAISIFKEELGE